MTTERFTIRRGLITSVYSTKNCVREIEVTLGEEELFLERLPFLYKTKGIISPCYVFKKARGKAHSETRSQENCYKGRNLDKYF